jgi:hypothetical protein
VLAIEYPESVAVAAANSRLAAYLARRGQVDAAIALYREIVARAGSGALTTNISNDMLAPYFALLAREIPRRPELVPDFFLAGETLIRPGVASTQAVLARELSAGDDEAARLFRQAITLTREVEQARVTLARLSGAAGAGPPSASRSRRSPASSKTLQASQAATQAKLGEFPALPGAVHQGADAGRPAREPEARRGLSQDEPGRHRSTRCWSRRIATAYRTALTPARSRRR